MNTLRVILPLGLVLVLIAVFAFSVQGAPLVVNMIDQLPRHAWERFGTRDMAQVSHIVMHHTAGDLTLNQIADIHINERGWAGIAYHFIIEKDGTVIQANSLNTVSSHVLDFNTPSIGIALIGNFQEEKPTRSQYRSARKLVSKLTLEYPQIWRVSHHRDHKSTSCPGQYFDITQVATSKYLA